MLLRIIYERFLVPILDYVFLDCEINGCTMRLPISVSRFYKDGEERPFHEILSIWATGMSGDIGAHIGVTTVIISKASQSVIAFEPSPRNFKYLEQVVKRNTLANVELSRLAVTGQSGKRMFALRTGRANNGNSLVDFNAKQELIEVDTIALDEVSTVFDFLKVDAEGAEHEIFMSNWRTIVNCKRIILSLHIKAMRSIGKNPLDILNLLLNNQAVILNQHGELIESVSENFELPDILELYVLFPKNEPDWQNLFSIAKAKLSEPT